MMKKSITSLIVVAFLFIACGGVIEIAPEEVASEPVIEVDTVKYAEEPEMPPADTLYIESEPKVEKVPEVQIVEKEEEREKIQESPLVQKIAFDDIYFDFGKYEKPSETIKPDYLVPLGKVVEALKYDEEVKVRLYGHADSIGSEIFNKALSEKRAATVGKLVINYFTSENQGGIADRIELFPIGEEKPLARGPIEYQNAINRRVSIELFYGDVKGKSLSKYLKSEEEIKKVSNLRGRETVTKSKRSRSPQENLYTNALQFFENKQYDKAIMTFEEILSIDAKHSLADNAQWWIGEAYYFQGKYGSALSAYRNVFGLGDGNKEAYAQLRIGYCFLKLNQKDKAVEEFKKVTLHYPDAKEEVEKASRILEKINSEKF
jgi:TolA-binding protein